MFGCVQIMAKIAYLSNKIYVFKDIRGLRATV